MEAKNNLAKIFAGLSQARQIGIMKNQFYTLIDFPSSATKTGMLSMFQSPTVPFSIKRVLVISDMKENDTRGGHTHHHTNQILLCIQGQCAVDLDNGKEKETIQLDASVPRKGLLLYPYVWHVMRDFKKDTILLVIADMEYDERDYIRSYDEFLTYVK